MLRPPSSPGARRSEPPVRATVLLVDDDPVILRCHARCLNDEFVVETCASAVEAERRIVHGGIDVVVSDVSMPGTTGVELLGALRARDARLPVILASASAIDHAEANNGAGPFVFLRKPVDPPMFRAAVRLAVQYRRSPRTLAPGPPPSSAG